MRPGQNNGLGGSTYELELDFSWDAATNVGVSVGPLADGARHTNIGSTEAGCTSTEDLRARVVSHSRGTPAAPRAAKSHVTYMFPIDFQHVNASGKIDASISQGDLHK